MGNNKMKVSGIEVSHTDKLPEEEGTYIRQHSLGFDIVKVYFIPPRDEFGMSWKGYFAAVSHGNKHISHLQGIFSKVEE